VFAGVVTLVSMGFFQSRFDGQGQQALLVGGVVAGVTFIVVLVAIALLILAVDPADVGKTIDRPVLLPEGEAAAPDAAAPDAAGPDAGAQPTADGDPASSENS